MKKIKKKVKNKLANALDEKKKLNQIIMKHEQEISKNNKIKLKIYII